MSDFIIPEGLEARLASLETSQRDVTHGLAVVEHSLELLSKDIRALDRLITVFLAPLLIGIVLVLLAGAVGVWVT